MRELLQGLLSVVVPFFAVASMASVGLGHSLQEIYAPLRKPKLILAALVANFVLVPLVAWAAVKLVDLAQPQAIGLFLIASGAGAAFTVMLTKAAGGHLALSTGLVVLLIVATLVYLPLVVPLALPAADFDVLKVTWTLTSTMLLPLALGLLLRARAPALATWLQPWFGKAGSVALVVLITATFLVNLPAIAGLFGTGAIPCVAALVLSGLLCGYALGGPDLQTRTVLGLATGQRNIAAAMVVASTGFESTEPLVMVVVSALVGFAILFPAAWLLRRRSRRVGGYARRVRFGAPDRPGDRRRA
jgi:BASS family bile acid:Na+ symporter